MPRKITTKCDKNVIHDLDLLLNDSIACPQIYSFEEVRLLLKEYKRLLIGRMKEGVKTKDLEKESYYQTMKFNRYK